MAQEFLADRDLGAFCIPYKVAGNSITPPTGHLSFYNKLDVRYITRVDIHKNDFNNNNILRYLTGSNKGNLTISSKNFPFLDFRVAIRSSKYFYD